MRNNRGITLIALVIMVIVILILSTVGINTGLNVIRESKYNRAIGEMKIMQARVNEIYDDYKSGSETQYGIQYSDMPADIKSIAQAAYFEVHQSNPNIGDNISEFRYLSKDYIKNTLDIDGIENDYFVNTSTRAVIMINGIDNQGTKVYSLSQIQNEQYNVDYINPDVKYSSEGDVFILTKTEGLKSNLTNREMEINLQLEDIASDENILVQYKWSNSKDVEPSGGWTTLDSNNLNVIEDGTGNITQSGDYYLWTRITDTTDGKNEVLNTVVSRKFTVKDEYDVNVKVALDAMGGKASSDNIYVVKDEQYGELPTAIKTGYQFNGWFTASTGGTQITPTSLVETEPGSEKNKTLYAQWTANEYDVVFNGNALPSEYIELEYIESTGTQWIDIGINGNARHEFDIQFTDTTTRQLMGYGGSLTEYWGVKQTGYYEVYTQSSYRAGNRDEIIHDYGMTKGTEVKLYVNGNVAYSYTGAVGTIANYANNNYKLFGISQNYLCKARLYSYKMYKNSILERNMVPCVRISDDVAGLYDTVYGVFYENNGSGEFIKGEKKQHFTYDVSQNLNPNLYRRDGYTFAGWNTRADGTGRTYTDGQSISNLTSENNGIVYLYAQWEANEYDVVFRKSYTLPNEYQEVNYIESTGTQFIDTGIYPKVTTKVVCDCQFTTVGSEQMNGWGSSSNQEVFIWGTSASSLGARVSNNWTVSFWKNATDINRHIFELEGNRQVLDGVKYGSTIIGSTAVSNQTMYLFGSRVEWSGNLTYPCKERIYSCQIYDDGVIVRNYIPCYRKSDNVVGLYDTVQGELCTNAGTGAFKRGTDMSATINGTMSNQHFVYDTSQNLASNTYTREGCTFTGWQDDKGNLYTDGQSIQNLTSENNGQVNLYARWTVDEVYFNGNSSSSKLADITTLTNIKRFEKYPGNDSDAQALISNGTAIKIDDGTTNWSIYAWFDNTDNKGAIYWWSDSNKVYLPNKSRYMWKDLTKIEYIDVTGIDTVYITTMADMFRNAGKDASTFTIVGLNTFNTSNVTTMANMFDTAGRNATTCNLGNLSNWNLSKVTSMSAMFTNSGYSSTTFNLEGLSTWTLNTTGSITMANMFNNTGRSATTFDLGNLGTWNTSKVTSMAYMFSNAGHNATTWNIGTLNNWNTSSVTNFGCMFASAGYAATTWNIGNISNWDVSKAPELWYMFAEAGFSAATWSIGDLSGWTINTTSNVNMCYMFSKAGRNATTWSIGTLNNWNTSRVTNMSYMFNSAGYCATTWNIGNIGGWDVSKVTNMSFMFSSAGHDATTWNIGNLSTWIINTASNIPMDYMFQSCAYNATTFDIGNIGTWDTSKVTAMNYMFSNAGYSATTWNIGTLNNWNVSNVTTMGCMFSNAGHTATTWSIGNIKNWDLSKVTDFGYMFSESGYNATTWSIGDLSGWTLNTTNNISMRYMFSKAGHKATTWSLGNIGTWDTSNLRNTEYMFWGAGENATTWTIGNIGTWNVSKITNMNYMFSDAGSKATTWTIGDLSTWILNTSENINMSYMFCNAGHDATTWSIGNISTWNTSKVRTMNYMFNNAGYNATTWNIGTLNNWNVSNVTSMGCMFAGAGYNSTTWNIGTLNNWDTSNVTDMAYMFASAGHNSTTWESIGVLKIYTGSIAYMFNNALKANGTLNLYKNSTSYTGIFGGAATSGAGIIVNYTSAVTNIDNIIATKNQNSNVTKGSLITQ